MTSDPAVVAALPAQRIELPSWAFGNSGTRFKVFAQQGVPRDPYEKIADAAQVHRFTGVAPTVALHIPWDKVDDYADLARHAAACGVALGTINSNTFQDDDYMLGSVCHPDAAGPPQGGRPPARLRRHHGRDRLARPQAVVRGRDQLPGPGRHPRPPGPARRGARRRSTPGSAPDQRMVLEYKFFEPSFYTMDVPGLGHRLRPLRRRSAPKAKVVVDTGHHAPGTNIEFIVASLLRARQARRLRLQLAVLRRRRPDGRRGRPVPALPDHARGRAGRRARARRSGVAFMLDQCHNIEPKIPGQIRSVMNVQEATAKALLVDRDGARRGPARPVTSSARTPS